MVYYIVLWRVGQRGDIIAHQDIASWSYAYMKKNEAQCEEYLSSLKSSALVALQNRKFSKAEAIYLDIVCGLEKLSDLNPVHYEPMLYEALFYLAKIYAFGLMKRWAAIGIAAKACCVAEKCAASDRPENEIAKNDLKEILKLQSCLENGEMLYNFGNEFKANLSEPSNKEFVFEDSFSAMGCFVSVIVAIVFSSIYLYLVGSNHMGFFGDRVTECIRIFFP